MYKIVAGKMKDRNYKGVAQRLKIDQRTLKRHKVANALSDEDGEKVRQFYLNDISRPMPNAKDVMYVKDVDGKRQPVPKHLLVVTQQGDLKLFIRSTLKSKLARESSILLGLINVSA